MTYYYCPTTGVKQPEGYTVWICEVDDDGDPVGTHHVSFHFGTVEQATAAAKRETVQDWYSPPERAFQKFADMLHVLGVARGDVSLVSWGPT